MADHRQQGGMSPAALLLCAALIGCGPPADGRTAGESPQVPARPKRRPAWAAPPAPTDAPLGTDRCRIVSYAGKWTRHGFSNYMVWRHPNGPLATRRGKLDLFRIAHDLDVDGDGRTDDDYVASLPFSLAEPLSNPDWPMHMAFPRRRSSRFYGGVSWYVANSSPQKAPFYCEMGYNPDHSPPWYDGRAEDHPLQGQANETNPDSAHRHYWAILWRKDDFLNGGDAWRVTFDETSRLASITTRDYWLGYDDVRMIVRDGERLYISDNRQFDIPRKGYRPAKGRVFLLRPTKATWAPYAPAGHRIHFDHANARFAAHEFKDVRAVGWYLAKDRLEGKQSHVKWYGFEADAVVHRPRRPGEHLAMVQVPAGRDDAGAVPPFYLAACEVPYALWRDIHRYGDAPFHTLEARYVYGKDGDMGSMLFGRRPHGPDEPVTNLTFCDALAFCNTLSEMEGKTPCYYADANFTEVFRNMHLATRLIAPPYKDRNRRGPTREPGPPAKVHVNWAADGYRLPTPAEWRRAYQAGGPGRSKDQAWTAANSQGTTHPVGASTPDALGARDLIGNVWELCWACGDVYDAAKADRLAAMGGDFNHPQLRSASPYGDRPWDGTGSLGLRIVRRPAGAPRPPTGLPAGPRAGDCQHAAEPVPVWTFRKGARVQPPEKPKPPDGPVLPMVELPGGTFVRGPDGTKITVSPFHAAKHTVTYARWKRVLHWAEAHGYAFSRTGDMGSMYYFRFAHSPDEPVTRITWHDMLVWCNALSEMEGRTPCYYTDRARRKIYRRAFTYRPLKVSGPEIVAARPHRYAKYSCLCPQPWLFVRWNADGYRLPTEAEFEFALRGGTETPFFWGSDPAGKDEYTWNMENAGGRTHPVGQKKPNPFGLCDIQGNTFEWLWSCDRRRDRTRPARLDTRNPKASPYWPYGQPKEVYSPHNLALVAGGSWLYGQFNLAGPHGVTVESHNAVNTVFYYSDVGFRPVRCEAGTHVRDGREKMADWPVVYPCDARNYDALAGAAFRGGLRRDGVFRTAGVAKLTGVKWTLDTGGAVRSSPVVVGGRVYVGSEGGHFHAVEVDTGREAWRIAVRGGVTSSACMAELASPGGPAARWVYFGGNDGALYAADAETGKVRWKVPGGGRLTCSPAVAHGVVFVEGAWGFDARTGKQVWSTTRRRLRAFDDTRMTGRLSSPIVFGDVLVQNGSVCDIRTARFTIGTGDPWAGQNCDALADGTIYTLNSGVGGAVNLPRITARDLHTGRSGWSREIAAPGQPVSVRKVVLCSPAVWDGKVYVGFDGGLMFCLDARDGACLWTFRAGGAIRSSPAVSAADGTLYFGCHDGCVHALDTRTGRQRWRLKTGGKVTSSPCPAAGVVYVGSDDGCLYAIH